MNDKAQTSAETFDIGEMPKIEHNWVDRGLKMSCEGANHPSHWVYVKNPKKK